MVQGVEESCCVPSEDSRYEKLYLSQSINNNCDDFRVDTLTISQEIGDYSLKEETIEIEEDPLKIDCETDENYNISKIDANTDDEIDFDRSYQYHSICAQNNDYEMISNHKSDRNTTKDILDDLDRIGCNLNIIKQVMAI